MNSTVLKWAAFLFALFHVYTNVFATLDELWFSAIHFGGFAALCALGFHKGPHLDTLRQPQLSVTTQLTNWLLALLAILVPVYLILFQDALYAREAEFVWSDYVVSILAIILAMEFTRRTSGWFMPALILLSLSYILFLGKYIPGVFAFPGLSLETVLYRSYYFSEDGMFGTVASISATYVFMFILFGAFLLRSGGGDFIIKLAQCVAGRFTGGAGMVAVVGSGLMGSVTGSAVANTVSTGVITIPMMNKSGFPARFSAGVVASASTGGGLMPPVMGAGAFVMANNTQIPYLQIIALATLPALLYFLTVAFFVRIEAKRLNLLPVELGEHEQLGRVLKEGWAFVIPLAILVGLLVYGYTPIRAAAVATGAVIVTSWLTPTSMNAQRCFEATLDAVRTAIPTALLLVAVGLVINVVNTTGIGNQFSLMIVEWAQGNLLVTLILIALASLVLGMGLPVTASYIVLATLSAPILFDLISQSHLLSALRSGDLPASVQTTIDLFGGDPAVALREMPLEMKQLIREQLLDPALLTGMLLSAHLIIFWLSQDSNITPPVCLAAFAAAGIAGTKPMATGLTAWKVSKGLYLVPLLFAYSPLVTGTWPERIEVFIWASFGLYAFAGLLQWHLEKSLNLLSAALLLLSGVLLTWAPFDRVFHMAGIVVLLGVIFWQKRSSRPAIESIKTG
ncbi:MAG: TRAP transporter fused permease subunit [Cellvibrionaceae bacterium]